MYIKFIDTSRKAVAVVFAVCGFGFVIAANSSHAAAAAAFMIGMLASLVGFFCLFLEYSIRWRLESRRNQASAYQFTLAEVTLATAAVALTIGMLPIVGWCAIAVLVAYLLLFLSHLEMARLGCTKKGSPTAPDGARGSATASKAATVDSDDSTSGG